MSESPIELRGKGGGVVFQGTQKPPGGGSQPGGILSSKDFLFTEEATNGPTLPVTAVDQLAQTFTVAGDHTARFPVDALDEYSLPFIVAGSTGNDGTYTLIGVTLNTGSTVITTVEPIPDATADGDVIAPKLYRASLPLLAGSVIDDVRLYNYSDPNVNSAWAADVARLLTVQDSVGSYYKDVTLDINGADGLVGVTPPLPNYSVDDTAQRSLAVRSRNGSFTHPWEGTWAAADALAIIADKTIQDHNNATQHAVAWAKGGGGIRFPADDTISLLAAAASATPPVTATGLLLVKVIYWTPITAVAAVAS